MTLRLLPGRPVNVSHTLYRALSEHGVVLYIGISHRPGRRLAQHEARSSWWAEVRSVTFETWPTLEAAQAAEAAAVRAEKPVYNKTRFITQGTARL